MPAPQLSDFAFASPAENLACDEAMLDYAEEAGHSGFLGFFESASYFVVLGYAKKLADEVFEEECARAEVPIFRRCSGGGTVLQGPGCFNYRLVLPIDSTPGLETITGANRLIMARNCEALRQLLDQEVRVEGYSDLAIDGIKFSGNAQRRKRRYLLYHGSILLDFDLSLVDRFLKQPTQQPSYRANREHGAFIRNIHLSAQAVAAKLKEAWDVDSSVDAPVGKALAERTAVLAREKYATHDWNRRF